MKKLLVLATALMIWSGAVRATEDKKAACCSKEALSDAAKPLSDGSIYNVESRWTNDLGKAVALRDFRGKPRVITMFFAKCEYVCPILVQDIKKIEASLPAELREKVGFTLVSFDTERDTIAELSKFRAAHELGENWNLLRGSSGDVLELAALLGIKFKKDARGQFAHSNVILVLNAEGEIVHQQLGLNQPADKIVEVLSTAEVQATQPSHPIHKNDQKKLTTVNAPHAANP